MNVQRRPDLVILHAGWVDRHLFLWGELPEEAALPGQAAGKAAPPTPSYGLPGAMLASLLRESLRDLGHFDMQPIGVTAWLPTMNGRPLPSGDCADCVARLAPWRIEALPLGLDATLILLGQGDEQGMLAPGLVLGSDLRFWQTAMRLAAALTVRQTFVPSVQAEGGYYAARWQPFIAGQDEARLAQLASGMPASCRALRLDGVSQDQRDGVYPPAVPAREVAVSFVAAVVDALVRSGARTVSMGADPGVEVEQVMSESLHTGWLAALRTPEARMAGDPKELASFAAQVSGWLQPLTLTHDPSVRLCFRLEEPELDSENASEDDAGVEGAWHVQYLLQATDDPSLLVPAETIWHAGRPRRRRGELAAALDRSIARPREKLLAALGRAAPLSPEIEASLRAPEPVGYLLNSAGAHAFLTETAWLLEQAGFGLLLPAWWTRTGTKLRLAGHAKIKSPQLARGSMSLDTLVTVDWQLALGDEALTAEELEALARLKTPLVRVRGQWVEVNARQIADALAFWSKRGREPVTLGQAMRLALGADRIGDGLPVTSVTSDGWVADLLARLEGHAAPESPPPPPALRGTLRPYQERGYAWLYFLSRWGLGACLADDMGLGKAQPLESGVLTPTGWKPMGDIQVGDAVINSQGGTSHVIGVYPQGDQDIYRVEFTDGSTTECSEQHLWYVNTPLRRSRGYAGRVLQLSAIRETLKDSVGNNQHFIPLVQPLKFAEGTLPIAPYLLGVLLGDGG
ncbi:MAG: SNF2 helicase-associated domain-containing protein, partial [Ktedonobacterales bacterium]